MIVVILECKKIIVVPPNWVENINSKDPTKIFFSPLSSDLPDFSLPTKLFFDHTEKKCYSGLVLKKFGKNFFVCIYYIIVNSLF